METRKRREEQREERKGEKGTSTPETAGEDVEKKNKTGKANVKRDENYGDQEGERRT